LFHEKPKSKNSFKPPKPNQKLARPEMSGLYFWGNLPYKTGMSAAVKTIINSGSSGLVVDAECHLSNGLPGMVIVGLGNKAVDEAKERIRSAFASSNIPMPRKRITINLAPADVPKISTSLDPAMPPLFCRPAENGCTPLPHDSAVIGELGLEGDVRPVRGIIGKLLWGKNAVSPGFFCRQAISNRRS
jgi:magnesium chelatase family protein